MFKRPVVSIILLILSLVFYLLLSGSFYLSPNILLYLFLLVPLYFIYFYIIFQVFRHEQDLPDFMWFLAFAFFYRLVFFLSDPLIPFYTCQTLSFIQGINEVNVISPHSPIMLIFDYLVRIPGGTIFTGRFILLIFEIILLVVLFKLARFFSMGQYRLLLVVMNPLWIIEIYRNGHLEIIGVLLLWLSVYLFYMKKDWFSLSLGFPAFMVHLLPVLAILPLCYHKFRWKMVILSSGIIILIILFSFISSESIPDLLVPMNREASNGAVYTVITSLIESLKLPLHSLSVVNWSGMAVKVNTDTMFYYVVLLMLSITILLAAQIKNLKMTATFRGANYLQGSFIIMAVCLILKPDLYPWHLIWILPYLIFFPDWSWLILTLLIQISYLALVKNLYTTDYVLATWLLVAQYVPFFVLLIFEYLDNRRIKGWF